MKTQGKETRQEITAKYPSFDKLEFAGASMFGVIKNRKTRMLSYEQVFMLDSHIQIIPKPKFILKETKLKTRSSQKAPQQPINNSYTTYSSGDNTSNDSTTTTPKVSAHVPNNTHIEIKKERRMLSFKELLN